MRDNKLDIAKGLAIILVILGHTIQNLDANFDDNLLFRAIYSFHMPLFVLLSGASASFWVAKIKLGLPLKITIQVLLHRIFKSAIYLLLPFFSWTIIAYYSGNNSDNLIEFLLSVITRTDLSLWFLPCIFWCVFYLCLGLAIIHSSFAVLTRIFPIPEFIYKVNIQLLIVVCVWLTTRTKIPEFFGSRMTNFFHGGLFFFYICGVFLQINTQLFAKKIYLLLSVIIFMTLVPFWSRIGNNNFTDNVPIFLDRYYIGAVFTVTVAVFGSLIFYLGINIIGPKIPKWISRLLILLGLQTLGIYAMQGYFISHRPYILVSILAPLAISLILERVPIFDTILLGKPSKYIG